MRSFSGNWGRQGQLCSMSMGWGGRWTGPARNAQYRVSVKTGGTLDAVQDGGSTAQYPFVSVVSLTFNRVRNITALLDALQLQTYPRDRYEIIVVDNGSTDGTAETIQRSYPHVRLIETGENLGTYSYSRGINAATGEYILMIDDDGLPVSADWIAQLVKRLDMNPRLGAAACVIRAYDSGQIAHDSPRHPEGASELEGYPVPAYNGTGVAFRARAIKDLEVFYPLHLFHSWVELRLCTILYDRGWQVRVFPGIEVYHCRPSGGTAAVNSYYGLRNYLWYVWELYPWPQAWGESLHYLASRAKAVAQRRVGLQPSLKGIGDALKGMPSAVRDRRPVSASIVRELQEMRVAPTG